jgi:iron complex outermembrane receptor protein
MLMRNVILLSIVSLFSFSAGAQHLAGTILDDQQSPLSGASVAVRRSTDSSVVKYTLTDAKGTYGFDGIAGGNYFVFVSHIGYADRHSATFTLTAGASIEIPALLMSKTTGTLAAVTVSTRKPPIEVRPDKTILNVEGTINSVGENALDLLRKSPGVMVDKDDNISLSGKNGVKVYIDGRQVPLNGTDLSDYLKTLQSSQIESIELITNPSARYDAEGNAGIINIRLKKNRSFGNNGSVTGGYSIGVHSNYNGGLSFNHRDARINWYGNYDYNNTNRATHLNLYRQQLDTLFDQHSVITQKTQSHTFKTGFDYFADKYNTFGIMLDGSLSDFTVPTTSRTVISYMPTGDTSRILQADNSSSGHRNNGNLNLNFHHTDTLGRDLSIDGNYGIYRIRSNQLQPNLYFDPSGAYLLYSDIYNILAPTDIDIFSFKTDYEQNLKKGKLGLGLKTSYVTSSNDYQQYDVIANSKLKDTLGSSSFNYKENINAVYANYSRPFKGWALQAGLRVENTNAKGISNGYRQGADGYQVYDSGFDRHYVDFFPSASLTWNKNAAQQWTLAYSRRIDRPAYQDLNPFEFRLDEYTYQKGNTDLRPQYTNSIGLTYVYKTRLVTTLNYSHVKDVFTQLVDTTDKSKAFLTKQNLATQDIASLNISYPLQIGWFSLFTNVNSYYSLYNANFGPGRTVDVHVFAVNVFAQSGIRLGKGWTGELSGFYTTPSVWQGTFKTRSIGSLDAGFQKSVLQKKGTIKVSVSDVFNTLHWTSVSDFAGQYLRASGNQESRQLKIYFTYKFGNAQVKTARVRKTGADEESKRVGSQGGGLSN